MVRLSAHAGVLYEDGRKNQWDLWGPFAGLEMHLKPLGWLGLWARLTYHLEDHFDSAGVWDADSRTDNRWSMGGGMIVRISDHLKLGTSYRYLRNDSLGQFSYNRHMVSLALLFAY
jgi:opacity protein-like surface antigen